VIDGIVSALDIVPTLGAAAGASLPPRFTYFGANILPLLRGQVRNIPGPGLDGGREVAAFVGPNPGAFRSGRYKIVWPGWWANSAELYDLSTDPTETTNLRRTQPVLFDTVAARSDAVVSEAIQNAIR
jgi:arylsulfatase A-like enzyme